MKKKASTVKNFGKKLSSIRTSRGLTQRQLSKATNISQRMIAYYEVQSKYPPAHLIVPLAKALRVSSDELLGMKNFKDPVDAKYAVIWRKLKKAALLPASDQKTLLQNLNDLLAKNGIKKTAVI